MPTYNPKKNTIANGTVVIESMDGTNYQSIQQSISSSYKYKIQKIYIKAENFNQLTEPLIFVNRQVNGNVKQKQRIIAIDPKSYQLSTEESFKNETLILDGDLKILYLIQPNQTVYFYVDTIALGNADLLHPVKDSNLKDFLETYEMFSQFDDDLIIDFEGE